MKEIIKNQVYELRTKSSITQEALAEAMKIAKFFNKSVEGISKLYIIHYII